nr:Chain R, CemX segment [Homo sapiens]
LAGGSAQSQRAPDR